MKVWLLYDCFDRLEGVYSEAAKETREEQFYEEALRNREHYTTILTREILELKDLRQPYLDKADELLDIKRVAKETNHTGMLKDSRKQLKVVLRQADKLTSEINRRETKMQDSQVLMKKDILATYGVSHTWQEEYVVEAD
jgi:hypothetical protein